MELSPTQYAKAGDLSIAYRVAGEGPLDLVMVPGWVSNVELFDSMPARKRFIDRLSDFARVIIFDKRGTGLSDRNVDYPTLEERLDDLRAVLDAAKSERPVVFGTSEGGSLSLLFAATHQERTRSLITFGAFAKRLWAEDYPWAPTLAQREQWIETIEREWAGAMDVSILAPSLKDDPEGAAELARYFRMSASPGMAVTLAKLNTLIDVREVLPAIRVPTLVMHRVGDQDAKIEEGAYIASRIPNSRFVRLAGSDHMPYTGDQDPVIDAIREFLTGSKAPRVADRILTTMMFTDIVHSTELARSMGDTRWCEQLTRHLEETAEEVRRQRGKVIKTTGDGTLAIFDGPARAIRCALSVQEISRREGLGVRAGVHTGEVELMGDDIGGIAVHVASRVMSQAGVGQVFTSEVVRDLSVGAGIEFTPVGEVRLKGLEKPQRLLQATA